MNAKAETSDVIMVKNKMDRTDINILISNLIESEIANRNILFYERNQFCICDFGIPCLFIFPLFLNFLTKSYVGKRVLPATGPVIRKSIFHAHLQLNENVDGEDEHYLY